MSLTVTEHMCTNIRYGAFIATPGGVVGGLTRDGWWSLPISHRPVSWMGQGAVVVDRWLDDACAHTSDAGWDRGHRWVVRACQVGGVVPLPRRGMWGLLDLVQVQQMAERTAAVAVGGPATEEPALLPSWAWWLWVLGRVRLPAADALGVLEYATAQEEGGLPRPRGETTLAAHLI